MTAQMSEKLEEELFGDVAILRDLSICEAAFVDGNRTALFLALTICARYQAVIPDWAADAILNAEQIDEAESRRSNRKKTWHFVLTPEGCARCAS